MLLTLPPMLSDKMMPLSIAVFPQTAPLAFIFDFHVDFSGSAGAEGVAVRRGGGGGGAAIVTVRPKEGKDGLRVLYSFGVWRREMVRAPRVHQTVSQAMSKGMGRVD